MKTIFKFDVGEVNIGKALADDLREKIKSLAAEKEIGTDPYQYEMLFKEIKSKMVALSSDYEFVFENKVVDFNKDNFVMFTSKVLKSFLSSKKNDEVITLQRKNLDILSLYAYNKPWNLVNSASNNFPKVGKLSESVSTLVSHKHFKKYLFIAQFSIFSIIIIWLILKNNYLQEHFAEKESVYQRSLNQFLLEYNQFKNFNPKNYYAFTPPSSDKLLIDKNFNNDTAFQIQYPGMMKSIFIPDSFISQPCFQFCSQLNGFAFGFGKSKCPGTCDPDTRVPYYKKPYLSMLRITFKDSTYISFISFKWVEIGADWGSSGGVYIDGCLVPIGEVPYQHIGNYPPSRLTLNETPRSFNDTINKILKTIDIAVWDIANGSEIFINEIKVWGK
ncbi:MAG: hypothetical protein HW421_2473 [Ignavibacteria bacterium]|nr:hypothetical protein [Ignavibacteria bacterium]